MVTMNGHLLVLSFGGDQFYLMSFKSPEHALRDTPNGKRIDFPVQATPINLAYGVLEIEGVQTLIVTGNINVGDKEEEF